jgi:hypothetical protein
MAGENPIKMSGSNLCIPRNERCTASLFPKQNYNVQSPNFHLHVSVSDLYIPRIGLLILLQPNMQTDPGNIKIAHRNMKVGIGNKAAQFHFLEHIN